MTATIASITTESVECPLKTTLHTQIESALTKTTRDQKPFVELTLVDATMRMKLRVWNDHPNFAVCDKLEAGTFVEIEGEFYHNGSYGLDVRHWQLRLLSDSERDALLAGPPELCAKQEDDFQAILALIATLNDPRLAAVCRVFTEKFGDRFRRTAAARSYHHARRGGLVEHVAQMMRAADALCVVYPTLNRDLLLTGTLLHDCGKLWENCAEENGFSMPYFKSGELLGHIPIGIELANRLYREVVGDENAVAWQELTPSNEDVRLHLLHLIGAHHGSLEFGSPVEPKTPEAIALHYIDNLDAKLEMFFAGYQTAAEIAPQIYDRIRPLPGHPVAPLAKFSER